MSKVRIHTDPTTVNQLRIHPVKAEQLGLCYFKVNLLRFGLAMAQISCVPYSKQDVHDIAISQNVIDQLHLPLFVHYELRVENETIQIGPYISFLVTFNKSLLRSYLHMIDEYMVHYEKVYGAVLAFSLEGVHANDLMISGYMYNPSNNKWVEGVFPYPDSVFVRGHVVSKKWCEHYLEASGRATLFNDFYLDKWQMHNLLQASAKLRKHLPATILVNNPRQFFSFLRSFSTVYLKPVHGTMGISIMKVTQLKKGLAIFYRRREKNQHMLLRSRNQAILFFKNAFQQKKFIAQQAIPLVSDKQRMLDFRLILVKNGLEDWEYMGMIARYGAKKSIVSNISAGGKAEKGEEALRRVLSLTSKKRRRLQSQMSELAMNVVHYLEQAGLHGGNIGIDIGIDERLKLWLIEIQHHSPAHSIALDAGDPPLYDRILLNNMSYLRRLAGFKEEGDVVENS